jgi:multimeric flavodoxin WrbA
MKVVLVNGSLNKEGCTHTALKQVAQVLEEEGIEIQEYWIGNKPYHDCIACRKCVELGKCVFDDDLVNEFVELARSADGFVFGSPVYYAGMTGQLGSFLDRAFFSNRGPVNALAFKPAACVTSARRAGTTATLDQMGKYLLHQQMPQVPSRYWNMVHGNTPEEVMQDAEGLQTMRYLARNLAWMLKCLDAGKKAGIDLPKPEDAIESTNFIR